MQRPRTSRTMWRTETERAQHELATTSQKRMWTQHRHLRLPLRLLRAAFVAKLFSVFIFFPSCAHPQRFVTNWLPAHKFELHDQLCLLGCRVAQGVGVINTTCMRLLGNTSSLCVPLVGAWLKWRKSHWQRHLLAYCCCCCCSCCCCWRSCSESVAQTFHAASWPKNSNAIVPKTWQISTLRSCKFLGYFSLNFWTFQAAAKQAY